MPTPSDVDHIAPASQPAAVVFETAPRQRRSVFKNYQRSEADNRGDPSQDPAANVLPSALAERRAEAALSRSFVHQYLARCFDYPALELWSWLTAGSTLSALATAIHTLESSPAGPLRTAGEVFARTCRPESFETFHDDYVAAIGHAARGSCPVNEIEYGDLKADPLFQPHRLADLAAFYRAFGMELGTSADERHDHLSVELEFMSVLAAQEATLANGVLNGDALTVCLNAQRQFLREHLARWTPAFARRLHRAAGDRPLGTLSLFTLAFIEYECDLFGVTPGSAELLLRPADKAAALCDGCGLTTALPGAAARLSTE
jgi:putative dimethyl sulfoxide reductase chaperone